MNRLLATALAILAVPASAQTQYGCTGVVGSWSAALGCLRGASPANDLADQVFYTKGSYGAYAAPFATYSAPYNTMVRGTDYLDTMSVDPALFPAASQITWKWPGTAPTGAVGVWGNMALTFGDYDSTVQQLAIPARKVDAIAVLTSSFRWTYAASSGDGFDLLHEFYLTAAPGTASGGKLFEIGFFLHTPPTTVTFTGYNTQLGTCSENGRTWTVARSANSTPFVTLVPAGNVDLLSGTIDVRAVLLCLKGKGVITGQEYFNGMDFGVEPLFGSGSVGVYSWSVTYS